MKFVIEGTWSGYTAAQRRVCHVELTTRKAFADAVAKIQAIEFTDHTKLDIAVRKALPRENITERKQYSEMIAQCVNEGRTGYVRVIDLNN